MKPPDGERLKVDREGEDDNNQGSNPPTTQDDVDITEEVNDRSSGLLPDDVLRHVLNFTEAKTYRFIAPVCRQWASQYIQVHGPAKITSLNAAASSLTTLLLYKRDTMADESSHSTSAHLLQKIGEHGDLPAAQWLFSRNLLTFSSKIARGAALGGHLTMLKWLRANKCWDVNICYYAATGGHLEVLKWLRAIGCDWNSYTCAAAAEGGHLEVLKWARANGCNWNKYTCSVAASQGHLDILKWARAHGCNWNKYTCREAASGGYLEVLKWARANGCQWDLTSCSAAARWGHLDVLKWARAHGCEWDWSTCSAAAGGGHLDVLKWAIANGCDLNESSCYSVLFCSLANSANGGCGPTHGQMKVCQWWLQQAHANHQAASRLSVLATKYNDA